MTAYWAMYLAPVLAALSPYRVTSSMRNAAWLLIGVAFTLLIGLRHEVGGDWSGYLDHVRLAGSIPFDEAVFSTDPAYAALNWLMALIGADIYGVNLVCGAIFIVGVFAFCRRQPFPWVAASVAVPYLTVVVAMGYTRQSVALGLIFLGLNALRDNRIKQYCGLIVLAALFHKSALVMLPLALLTSLPSGRLANSVFVTVMGTVFGLALLYEHYEALWENYVVAQQVSEGGPFRIWMNAAAALVLLFTWKRCGDQFSDNRVWAGLAILSLLSVGLVGLASTAVDRVALYFTPLQVAMFGRLPAMVADSTIRTLLVVGILVGYGLVLWVWLNFALHAPYWLPYMNALFG